MNCKKQKKGAVLILTVFVIALLSTVVTAILQMDTAEIRLMENRLYAAQALALAEAGLNKAMAQIRNDDTWRSDMPDISDSGGTTWYPDGATLYQEGYYDLGYDGSTVLITAGVEDWQGYVATIEADVTVSSSYPHIIRIDRLKVNEPQTP